MTTSRAGTITIEVIVNASLAVGIKDLSVSAVAAHLGVTNAAIYHHVPSRDALVQHVVERVVAMTDDLMPTGAGQSSREFLMAIATSARTLERTHPAATQLAFALERGGGVAWLIIERLVATMIGLGHDLARSIYLVSTVGNVAFDLAERETRRPTNPIYGGWPPEIEALRESGEAVAEDVPGFGGDYFEFVMAALVDGLLADEPAPWDQAAPR